MEEHITEQRLYHQHLFRLDDDLNARLLNHMEEYGFSLSMTEKPTIITEMIEQVYKPVYKVIIHLGEGWELW